MNRRGFLAMASASLLPLPLAAAPARIGWVTAQRPESTAAAIKIFRSGLVALGWAENRDVILDIRYGNDELARVPELVEDLLRAPLSLLIVQGGAATSVSRLTLPVPVVFLTSSDPIAAGFAESLARPRNGLTGLTFMAIEMNTKRIEILREIIPTMRRIVLMGNPAHAGVELEQAETASVARKLGLSLTTALLSNEQELAVALERMAENPPDAVSLLPDGLAVQYRQQIIDRLLQLRVPVVSGWSIFAESGALCTYGPRLTDSYQRLAGFVDRILRGARPSDLPIERPSVFELVLNQRTASRLGITIPTSIMVKADEVIE